MTKERAVLTNLGLDCDDGQSSEDDSEDNESCEEAQSLATSENLSLGMFDNTSKGQSAELV